MIEAAATALTTLSLLTSILMTKFAILVKVEKMDDRVGSSEPCGVLEMVVGSKRVVSNGRARAIVRSIIVKGSSSLMMHPTKPGGPSNPAARSGSASYTSVIGSVASGGGVWSSSWISTISARAGRAACR